MMNVKKDLTGKNGLDDMDVVANQLSYIKNSVLRAIFKSPNSWPFHKPVDVVSLDLPDYFDIIKKPMDMGTIQKKIDEHQYSTAQECIDDFRLMCSNCYKYNGPNDEVVIMCKEIEDTFNKKIAKMPTELNNGKRGRGRAPASVSTPVSTPLSVPPLSASLSASLPTTSVPTSNGSVAGNSSFGGMPAAKKELKGIVASNNLIAPAPTPKVMAAVDPSRHISAVTVAPVASAATNTIANCSVVTLETHSSLDGSTSLPASKTKKAVKRKAEDTSVTRVGPELSRSVSSQPGTSVQPVAVNNRRENTGGRLVKRTKKECPDDQGQRSNSYDCKKLHTEALTYCHSILMQLFQKPYSVDACHFYNNVDPKTPGNEGYYEVIRRPMCLLMVKKNLENNVYRHSSEFAMDMRQIFTNCYRYHSPEDAIVRAAKQVQDFFELNFAKAPDDPADLLMTALSSMDATGCNPAATRAKGGFPGADASLSESSVSSDDECDSEQEKRETELRLLQDQLFQVQQEFLKLSRNIEKEKKRKSRKKPQEKLPDLRQQPPVVPSVTEQPVLPTKAVEPTPKPLAKPAKPARTKPALQKKTAPKAAAKATAAAAAAAVAKVPPSANIPESVLPPPPPASPLHLSRDEQNQLREDIDCLSEDAHIGIVQIIRSREPSLDVMGDEIEIDFQTLKPCTIMEIREFVRQCSQGSTKKIAEPEKRCEDLVDVLSDNDLRRRKKAGTLDKSPVHLSGHLLPQQPMRPSTTAAPKPHSRTIGAIATSAAGSQVRQPAPEPLPTLSPSLPSPTAAAAAVELRQVSAPQDKQKSPPPVGSHEVPFPKSSGISDQKTLPSVDRRLEEAPLTRPMPVLVAAVKPAPTVDKPHSPSTPVLAAKKPAAKPVGNSNEDSSSPRPNAKPGSSLMSSGTGLKPVPSTTGPFGVDMLKMTAQRAETASKMNTTGWSFANLAASAQSSSMPKQMTDKQFNRFKQIAHERKEMERANQEKEAMRQQRVKMEEEERERRKRELQKAREEEEALTRMLSSSESQTTPPQPPPSLPPPAVAPEAVVKDQLTEQQQKEQERLREQQRRRREAQSNKIDMNFQSDLLASFESNYRLNSTL